MWSVTLCLSSAELISLSCHCFTACMFIAMTRYCFHLLMQVMRTCDISWQWKKRIRPWNSIHLIIWYSCWKSNNECLNFWGSVYILFGKLPLISIVFRMKSNVILEVISVYYFTCYGNLCRHFQCFAGRLVWRDAVDFVTLEMPTQFFANCGRCGVK